MTFGRSGLISLLCAAVALAQSPIWAQCGGDGFTGSTDCVSGTACTVLNTWFSQCIPVSVTSTIQSPPSSPSTSSVASSTPSSVSSPPPSPTSSSPQPTSTANDEGFVTTNGQKFSLNGEDYVVAGTNAYWLAQESDPDIETAFEDIVGAGLTTVRTMGFNDVTTPQEWGAYYQLWQNGTATFNTGAFGISRFDSVVASAKAHGIRLIVALVNNWSDFGGMDVYVSQLNPNGTHDTFYTDETIIAAYETYINNFVGRYVNETAIMAWELANEPRCAGSTGTPSANCDTTGSTINTWAQTISAYIKSIDPNHLVAIGDEGFFQEANPPTYPYAPYLGIDFVKNLEIPTLDFGTFHSYPESWGQQDNASAWGTQWIIDHATAQKNANKPVIMEEFGMLDNQADTYTGWWSDVVSSGLTGDLIWQAGSVLSDGPTPDDGYAVYPTGTIYPIMATAAAALKQRG